MKMPPRQNPRIVHMALVRILVRGDVLVHVLVVVVMVVLALVKEDVVDARLSVLVPVQGERHINR